MAAIQSVRRVLVLAIGLLGGCADRQTGDGDSAGGSESASASADGGGSGSASASGPGSASADGGGSGSASGAGSASASATATADASDGASADGSATDGSAECTPRPVPNPDYLCCDGEWIDPRSDRFNCGGCANACGDDLPFCDQGTCAAFPCDDGQTCVGDQQCCGTECCGADTICCTLNGPIMEGPGCVPPSDDGNCPAGCAPLCQCAAPETPIATPTGDRSIASLRPGDLVYSVDDGETTVVPIARVQRVPVHDHQVVRATFDDGRVVRISASHPLADGRGFGNLRVGQRFGDHTIVDVETVAYDGDVTYDILPMSSTASYFVAGERVASTMADPPAP